MPRPDHEFAAYIRGLPSPKILELGTRRSNPANPTHHKAICPHGNWVMADFQDGLDVDVVADAHCLTKTFGRESFDAFIACSVFEHIQRPWIAAQEVAGVLKPNGMVLVQTVHSFVIHGYPSDYWRFTADALKTIFEDAGLVTIGAYYDYPCFIVSSRTVASLGGFLGLLHKAYSNVTIVCRKP